MIEDRARRFSALVTLVPQYLAARKNLPLRDALWTYWIASEAPVGLDLPIFSAAVEALKKCWLQSANTNGKAVYIEKRRFDELLGDLFGPIRSRLEREPGADAMVAKITHAYQKSGAAQLKSFLADIGLPIGRAEKSAIDARHKSAHEGVNFGAELKESIRHTNAYRTLFERTFLRLIGYEGEYRDWTTLGFPARPLTTPPGG